MKFPGTAAIVGVASVATALAAREVPIWNAVVFLAATIIAMAVAYVVVRLCQAELKKKPK